VTSRPYGAAGRTTWSPELEWDTIDELRATFASAEGRATAAEANIGRAVAEDSMSRTHVASHAE
jgi:hypothetical protein